MRKYLCLFIALLCINFAAMAAPGDTTWVQANNVQLTYYNNYDTTIVFPAATGTTYRKIYMIFTLGKYMCAGYNPAAPGTGTGGTGWCGDWDYTVQNFLMTPGGDTLELGRLITPYANALSPRTPWSATQHYVYDVTDYVSLLHDSATMRILFSGYSGGFTANIQFAFIEGTPDRNVLGLQKLWNGSPTYGDISHGDSNDINTHFPAITATAPAGTDFTDLKFTVTGHGSDANGCCEFAEHNYQVMLDSSSIFTQAVWRDNCPDNELYPQSGTWLFRRANWCPGDMVYSNFHPLPGIIGGTTFNVAVKFDPYSVASPSGVYTSFGTIIYYGHINKSLDAAIEDIIAPTNDDNHFRENPTSGQPILHIHNAGSTQINSVSFQYGVVGSPMQTYTWVGTLPSLADTQISLTALSQLDSLSGVSGTYNFITSITSVNGLTDNDQTNDTDRSQFIAAPVWASPFKIRMLTNSLGTNTNPAIAVTSWTIYDKDNTVVMQRANCALSTVYVDTINLPVGYYRLAITDSVTNDGSPDGNFFGLDWFEYPYFSPAISAGSFKVEKLNAASTPIPMHGYQYTGVSYDNDFGEQYSQYFYVSTTTLAVNNVNAAGVGLSAFPNPAKDQVTVSISGLQQIKGNISIIDALGRVVSVTACSASSQQVDISRLSTGVYTILFMNDATQNKLETKLLIAK